MVQLTRPVPRPWPNPHISEKEFALYTAKMKMKNATKGIASKFLWKFGRGPEVLVKWPVGWVDLSEWPRILTSWESADPNDHYRPWLTNNVGEQGWDWDWCIGSIAADNGFGTEGYDTVCIKLRKKHEHFASVIALKWA
jgi:hypothetical protein